MNRRSFVLVISLTIVMFGCAIATYKVHPGAGGYVAGQTATPAQIFDSQEYDVLVAANAVNQQVQADYLANKYPTSAMPTIRSAENAAVSAYNIAQAQWLAFDGALKAGGTPSEAGVQSAVAALQQAEASLSTAKGAK